MISVLFIVVGMGRAIVPTPRVSLVGRLVVDAREGL